MLTSPITITIGAQAYSLKRINQDSYGSVHLDKATVPGTEVKLTIRNSYEGKSNVAQSKLPLATRQRQMERHIVDLEVTTFDVDGFPVTTQSYQHVRNARGSDPVVAVNVAKALDGFVTANAAALVAWES